MKYKIETTINKSLNEVVTLFNNEENMYKWMDGLQSVELLSGNKGKVGARSKMKFKNGKREIEMIENILAMNLPKNMITTYDAKGVHNIIYTCFESKGDQTIYSAEQEFRFTGIFMKAIAFLMPGAFKKQSKKYMEDFKKFAESN